MVKHHNLCYFSTNFRFHTMNQLDCSTINFAYSTIYKLINQNSPT